MKKKKMSPKVEQIIHSVGSGYYMPRSWPNSETALAYELWVQVARLIVPPSDTFRHCLTQWVPLYSVPPLIFGHMNIVGEWTVDEIEKSIAMLVRLGYAGLANEQVIFLRPGLEQVAFIAEAANAAMHTRQLELLIAALKSGEPLEDLERREDTLYGDLLRLRMVMLAQVRQLAPDHPMLGTLDGLTDEFAWLMRFRKKLKSAESSDPAAGASFSI